MTEDRQPLTSLRIDYDEGYGIDRRTGWSICLNGSYVVQFAPTLIWALCELEPADLEALRDLVRK